MPAGTENKKPWDYQLQGSLVLQMILYQSDHQGQMYEIHMVKNMINVTYSKRLIHYYATKK